MNLQEEIERSFVDEPVLRAPQVQLAAGRKALRRRRLATGVGAGLATLTIGGAWVGLADRDGLGPDARLPVAETPSTSIPGIEIPFGEITCRTQPVCLGDTYSPLSPPPDDTTDGTRETPFLGWQNGELVRYRHDFTVLALIPDPYRVGATGTAAIELEHGGARFRALLTDGFGFQSSRVRDGDPATLAAWFATVPEHGSCGGQLAKEPDNGGTVELAGCPTLVDGRLVPPAGATVLQRVTGLAELTSLAGPGVDVEAWRVRSEGLEWYLLIESVADGQLYDINFAPARDDQTLNQWAAAQLAEEQTPDRRDGAQ